MSNATWHYAEMGINYNGARLYARVTATGVEYPWLAQREAQSDAASNGRRAIFYSSVDQARSDGLLKGNGTV